MSRLAIVVTHPIQYYAPLYRELARRHEVRVFFAHRQDAAGQAAAGFGVAFEWDVPLTDGYDHTWLNNVSSRPGLHWAGGCDTPELAGLIHPKNFDAVIVNGWNHKCYQQAIRAAWSNGVAVFSRGDSQLGTPRSWWKRLAKELPYRLLLPRFSGHLCTGKRNHDYFRHYGVPEARLFSSPHFVDTDFFSTRAAEARREGHCAALRVEWGVPAGARVLLFAGKFIAKKRPQDFITACVALMRQASHSDVHAVLVGDGPMRGELESLAAAMPGRIHFAGFRNQSELPACYAAGEALVLCSDGAETWGLVVNEAAACGLPVVVSDAAGCGPDMVAGGSTGVLFPCGDTDALTGAMAQALDLARLPEFPAALAKINASHSCTAAADGVDAALRATLKSQ